MAQPKLDFVFPFADQVNQAASLALPDASSGPSFLLVGVPGAASLRRLLELRAASGYMPPIDIIEPDMEIFSLWLRLIDESESLGNGRLGVFVGPDALEQYREALIANPARRPGTHCTTNLRRRWNPPAIGRTFFDSVHQAAGERKRQAKATLDARYAGKDAAHWSNRFATARWAGPPLRIVGFTTHFSTVVQHAMAGLEKAFTQRGCRFEIVKEPDQFSVGIDVGAVLSRTEFDLVIVLNHVRAEYADVMPTNIPYVCWIQDFMDRVCDKKAGVSVGDLDLVICHSPDVMASLYEYPLHRCLGTHNLTDSRTYDAEPLSTEELEPYRCDISFASHASSPPEQLVEEIAGTVRSPFGQYLHAFVEIARQRLDSTPWINSQQLVELMLLAETKSNHPSLPADVRRSRVYPQIASLYDRLFRHQALEWTANWARSRRRRFRLYGRGWECHPTLAEFASGEIASGRPMRCLYQASAINLQVNGYSALHQRLLDGLAAGGFVISRFNPADFLRAPFGAIQRMIVDNRVKSLLQLLDLRQSNSDLNAACQLAEELTDIRIAPMGDSRRQSWMKTLRDGNAIGDMFTDEGLFEVLAQMRFIPNRVAADIPNFEQTTFKTEAQLHALLDDYVDNVDARNRVSQPMRESVIAHDTFDSLVERILCAFQRPRALQAPPLPA